MLETVQNYTDNEIPFNTQWSDIDYMMNYWDFTFDGENYADLPSVVNTLHSKNLSYIPIVDAGLALR